MDPVRLVETGVLVEEEEDSSRAQPFIYEDTEGGMVSLFFRIGEVQSQMLEDAPDDLVLPYTRTMMAFLLFNSSPRHIAMIGLGGGSMAKWCYREFPESGITAVEINPYVIELRESFYIPEDDERFRVLCEDGARYVVETADRPDVLLIDGFGAEGQPPELCTQSFYDDCYRALHTDGVMVVNLCDVQDEVYIARIRRSFGDQVLVAAFDDGENRVVFAGKGNGLRPETEAGEEFVKKLRASSACRERAADGERASCPT
jgi:spermidine synthase